MAEVFVAAAESSQVSYTSWLRWMAIGWGAYWTRLGADVFHRKYCDFLFYKAIEITNFHLFLIFFCRFIGSIVTKSFHCLVFERTTLIRTLFAAIANYFSIYQRPIIEMDGKMLTTSLQRNAQIYQPKMRSTEPNGIRWIWCRTIRYYWIQLFVPMAAMCSMPN